MTDSPLLPEELLHRVRMRLSVLSQMLFATYAGDALTLSNEELRALAGYLEELRDDVGTVLEEELEGESTGAGTPPKATPRRRKSTTRDDRAQVLSATVARLNRRSIKAVPPCVSGPTELTPESELPEVLACVRDPRFDTARLRMLDLIKPGAVAALRMAVQTIEVSRYARG